MDSGTLSTHPITHPLNTLSQHTLSTHPLNTPYQQSITLKLTPLCIPPINSYKLTPPPI